MSLAPKKTSELDVLDPATIGANDEVIVRVGGQNKRLKLLGRLTPTGGDEGQILVVGPAGMEWQDFPSLDGYVQTPAGGNTGDALVKNGSGGYTWATPFSGSYGALSGKPTLFDGAYGSLSGRPTLGTASSRDVGLASGNVPLLDSNGKLDPSVYAVAASTHSVVSSGDLSALTAPQQASITEGSVVAVTDGTRYLYTGTGSKTDPASYIVISDTTPDWSVISSKPTFATVATSGAYNDLAGKPTLGTAAAQPSTAFAPASAGVPTTGACGPSCPLSLTTAPQGRCSPRPRPGISGRMRAPPPRPPTLRWAPPSVRTSSRKSSAAGAPTARSPASWAPSSRPAPTGRGHRCPTSPPATSIRRATNGSWGPACCARATTPPPGKGAASPSRPTPGSGSGGLGSAPRSCSPLSQAGSGSMRA